MKSIPIPILFAIGIFATVSGKAFAATRPASNHPVSVVEADIYVTRTRITMRLKCFAEDLELLQGVEALEDGMYDSEELLDATKDHAKYLAEKITIRDAKGELLEPRIIEIVNIDIPAEGIKAGTLMNYPMGFVLEFNYEQPPEFITIQQDMVADGSVAAVRIEDPAQAGRFRHSVHAHDEASHAGDVPV